MTGQETVQEFFANTDVFLTGGTGFIGKVLIEKLLRSCPDVRRIYVLMRFKRDKTLEKRVEELCSSALFDTLREQNASALKKVTPIFGDITLPKLGMYEEDIRRLESVSVVFHLAASVRFNDPLSSAIMSNIRSTQELFEIFQRSSNVRAVVHVSTAYSNPEHKYMEEKVYPAKYDWKVLIKAAEYGDTGALDILMDKLSNFAPNTYSYTKGLAEHVCCDYQDKLPITIVRPSVVIYTMDEPLAGWTDSLNGPVGLMTSAGAGIVRTAYLPPQNRINVIPVDVVVKTIILAAWKRGTIEKNLTIGHLPLYNSAVTYEQSWIYKSVLDNGRVFMKKIPLNKMLWRPGGSPTDSKIKYYFLLLFTMLLPAFVLDLLLRIFGYKPFLMKLQRRVYASEYMLRYFTRNEWKFETTRMNHLQTMLDEKERAIFGWKIPGRLMDEYFYNSLLTSRRMMLKESDDTIPLARRKWRIMQAVERTVMMTFLGILLLRIYQTYLVGMWVINIF